MKKKTQNKNEERNTKKVKEVRKESGKTKPATVISDIHVLMFAMKAFCFNKIIRYDLHFTEYVSSSKQLKHKQKPCKISCRQKLFAIFASEKKS